MKNKIFTLALLMLMITVTGIWAQNLPNSIWSSPQSTTTEGRYRSNADDFIRPDSYLGVKFNKWFGFTSFLSTENVGPVGTAGFAAKAGNVYIGAFYNGNLWANAPVNNYIEQEPNTTPNGGTAGKVYDVYNSISVSGPSNPINNVAVLIGVADMGIRLTYRTNYQLFDKSDIVTGNQLYKSYHDESGYIAPQIAWAMAKDLSKNGIRPYITVDLVFNRDYKKTEANGPVFDVILGEYFSGEYIGRSLNHIDPSLSLGLGGYTLYNKDGFKFSGDLDYVLTLYIYDNEYTYVDGDKYKTAKIKGTYSPGSFPYVERSFVSNLLTPSLSGSWSKEKVALKFKLNLPLTLSNEEQNDMGLNSSNKLIYVNANDSTTTFTFRPDLRLAMQYKVFPDKLTLNTGARLQATAITMSTVDRTYYNAGTKTSTQKLHRDSLGTSFVSRFHIGATFNFSENVWAEAATGISNAYGDGAIDVFAPGGLFSFGNILIAFKF